MASVQTTIKFPVRKSATSRRKIKPVDQPDQDKENSPTKKPQLESFDPQRQQVNQPEKQEIQKQPPLSPSKSSNIIACKPDYRLLTKQALHTSLPDSLVCRDSESKFVSNYIADHIENAKPGSLYISGSPGTGKTAVLNVALASVPTSSPKIFINCMSQRNSHAIYSSIWLSLSSEVSSKSKKSTSRKEMGASVNIKDAIAEIENLITSYQHSIVLVLDEIDSLDSRNQEVLYTIFEWPSLKDSKLILIGIANSLDLTDRILPRLQSREACKPDLMNFAPYTKDEIAQIILDRLSKVVCEPVLDPPAVHFCARKVSSMAGDLRLALDVCRRAVEIVEMEDKKCNNLNAQLGQPMAASYKKVTIPVILRVINEVYGQKVAVKSESQMTIPLQQMLVLCTMLMMGKVGRATKEIALGKLHENFSKVCQRNGVGNVEQGEFLSLCLCIEDRGLVSIKKSKQVRLHKLSLRVNEQELESVIQDKTLLASILQKGI